MSTFKKLLAVAAGAAQRVSGGIRSGGGPVSGYIVAGHDVINNYLSPTQATAPHQLPTPAPDFVGREIEISKIEETVVAGKPAGIFGLGGTGKTEVARVAANRLATRFPDAQLLIDLHGGMKQPRRPDDALFNSVLGLHALSPGMKPLNSQELRQLYLSALSGKRALVVLDDGANLDQVRPLLPPAGCGLIVTARAPIAVPGLVPLLLKELPRETALKLFSSIARNVDTKIAEQICSFCGFLPLAIRACATRLAFTPDLEPRDYAAQLGDEKTRLETIANPEIGLNVETALNASYRFLNKEEARVFGQLVVFPGSRDADTEEYVCEDRSHRALSQLVRLALVSFDKANARYRLHDLVRLYAAGRSDPASDAVHERQSEYLAVRVVAKAVPPDRKYDAQSKAFARCKQEWGNIQKGQSWAAKNIERREKAAGLCIIYAFSQDAFLFETVMPPSEHVHWAEDGLRAARKLGNISMQCNFLRGLGAAYTFRGASSSADKALREALQLARKAGLKQWEGRVLKTMATALSLKGQFAQAAQLAQCSATILNELNDSEAAEANHLVQSLRREPSKAG